MASPSSSIFQHHLSDENYAEELQLQEVITSSLLSPPIKIPIHPSPTPHSSTSQVLCSICTDAKSHSQMFTNRVCTHTFCTDCISKHIAAKLEVTMAVKCPEPNCGTVLEPEMCGSFVPKRVLERWADALFEAMILKSKRLNCPFKDCGAAMIDEGDEEGVTAVECGSCWRLFCAECRVGWHGEMKCGEFQRLRKEAGVSGDKDDAMTVKLAENKKWRRCPHCKIYVEKTVGCVHILCRCGSEFCYSCGGKWGGAHACRGSAYERTVHRR
ncbi:E3 ubiquitin-protein ligase RNF144B-like protein [Cucumis melo var. makuwa]|uniref:RBR-type E3 ubiquitin transferase n=2 Tax=Cucumis melo TaxID=3656 RepID=A0A5A7UED3_CUCMM|nr:E3 ubiquitin-protein ligase RNF144B-like protein [Cucumis melo var. makuwa]TYK19145.1 E3 ubiquitin-protein ligase RNF144B-like protein [Cucumis melo var. makuwa]